MELRFRTDDHKLFFIVKGDLALSYLETIERNTKHVATKSKNGKDKILTMKEDFKLCMDLRKDMQLMLYSNYYVIADNYYN